MDILQEAELWVTVGLVIFLAILVFAKVPGMGMKALDARGIKIKAALAEAEKLREDAKALLASIQTRSEETEALAKRMLAEARLEAERMETEAKVKLEEQIARRTDLADRRIKTAEAQAAQDVRAAAVEMAAQLAEAHLADRLKGAKSDPLVDRAVGELAGRLQ